MENVQTMSDLMQQIQQRIDSIKASAMQPTNRNETVIK